MPLINRLRRGDIYRGESIPRALGNFFNKGNIVALRELALRLTAEEVDDQLQVLVPTPTAAPARAAHDRVVVCVSPQEVSFKLVRRGYRLARRIQGDFICLHVRSPERRFGEKEEALLQQILSLARELGGEVVELHGESIAEQIISYVNANQTTMVVMGQSATSRWEEILRGSLVTRLMRETKNTDIVVVADSAGRAGRPPRLTPSFGAQLLASPSPPIRHRIQHTSGWRDVRAAPRQGRCLIDHLDS